MSELLLELLSEEIPATMQKNAEDTYQTIFSKILLDNDLAFTELKILTGARRISFYVNGLPEIISEKMIEIKGPRVDSSEEIISRFCQSCGVSKERLSEKIIGKHSFYIYNKQLSKVKTRQIIYDILPQIISAYSWAKSMYYGEYSIKWVRPLRNILCLFDNEILPIKYGHLEGNNITFGHKFIAPERLIINSFADYEKKLQQNYVIIDREERKKLIEQQLQKITDEHNIKIFSDDRLLDEVIGLVEYPTVMIGKISEKHLTLPKEVLITSMRTHQKYFSAIDNNTGKLAPYFLFVSNNLLKHRDDIVKGNEKVLSARLDDALYFYDQDLQKPLEDSFKKLANMYFHTKLGDMQAKTLRIEKICEYLSPNDEKLQKAARYCKLDLISDMVGEFPELQGIMGYYYTMKSGIDYEISVAIRDHYRPAGAADTLPESKAGLILALSDKIDSLVGLMLAGEKATSSKDPYALRRYSISIIRIILTIEKHINLEELVKFTAKLYNLDYSDEILEFIYERAKFYFKDEYDINLINALFKQNKEDLSTLKNNIIILKEFTMSQQGCELIAAYKRVNNILGDKIIEGDIKQELFKSAEEQELFNQLNFTELDNNLAQNLTKLCLILPQITAFFDNVLVNDTNPLIACNRFLLLYNVRELFNNVVRFDYL